jgi:hypothetical protein
MDTTSSLPPEVWERMPVEAQAYSRALDARAAVLEAMVQRLQATVQQLTEQLQQEARLVDLFTATVERSAAGSLDTAMP